ncbi:MAG: LLM class flavin-dependent oxidoreductase [Actinomycetales bacterium]|nr:LLM class flavin-dependent oxidoreductase [Actinomycetales bacterium]
MTAPVLAGILRPEQPPETVLAAARAGAEAGLEEVWIWEDAFSHGAAAIAGAILGATERMRVGIGVMPFPLRNPALAAMEVAALSRAFPGRVLPGFGHGVQEWMGQAGARARSVLTLEREYVAALRALLAGEEVTASGEYVHLDGVRLSWPPSEPPALHLAATGPRSLRLAGEIGDGVILTEDTTVADWPRIRDAVLEGAAASGRPAPEFTLFLPPVSRDAREAAEQVRGWIERGITRVALQPPADEPDPGGFLRWVACEVAPALAP